MNVEIIVLLFTNHNEDQGLPTDSCRVTIGRTGELRTAGRKSTRHSGLMAWPRMERVSLSNAICPISALMRKDATAKLAIKKIDKTMLPKTTGKNVLKPEGTRPRTYCVIVSNKWTSRGNGSSPAVAEHLRTQARKASHRNCKNMQPPGLAPL